MCIRILLACNREVVREGVQALLARYPEMQIIGKAETSAAALNMTRELRPDIVVLDLGLSGVSAITMIEQITGAHSGTKVLALSRSSDRCLVQSLLRAGAAACLLENGISGDLARAVRAVAENQSYFSPGITRILVEDYVHILSGWQKTRRPQLSTQERSVLKLLVNGKTTNEAASSLHLSVRTVEAYRRNIMNKLNLHRSTELVKYAIGEGLLSFDR